jgi:hypothetical protein
MDNLIRNYSDVLTPEKCQYFIDKFEAHPEMQEVQNNSKGKTLTVMNLMNSSDTPFREDLNFLGNIFMTYVEKYKEDCDIKSFQFPKEFGVEAFKMKRYMPNGKDAFPAHIDVNNRENARRFLVMFVYLNDNRKGETLISPKDDMFVSSCKKGSIVLFPPMWPWIHAGKEPVNVPKYIIGSYLHYAL